jgi:hypothetical protein
MVGPERQETGKEREAKRLLFAALALFDHDHLAAVVPTAARADVMRKLEFVAVAALDQVNCGDEVMPAAVALTVPANTLLRKRAHFSKLPYLCLLFAEQFR